MRTPALDSIARDLRRGQRDVSHRFGSERARGENESRSNAAISKEEWCRRGSEARAEYESALRDGEQRKSSSGAFPKDVLKRMERATREMDLARQFGDYR